MERAKAEGVSLVGPGGLLSRLAKTVPSVSSTSARQLSRLIILLRGRKGEFPDVRHRGEFRGFARPCCAMTGLR
jgi:hypothetical protein